jgi:hypothetical protein
MTYVYTIQVPNPGICCGTLSNEKSIKQNLGLEILLKIS